MKKLVKWLKRALTRRNIIILVVLIILGGIAWSRFRPQDSQSQTTYTVTKGNIEEVVLASGEVTASRAVTLNFPTAGKLAYINVKPGDLVDKYESLAGLDVTEIDIAIREAYYRYLSAEATAQLIEDQVKGHDKDENFTQRAARTQAQTAQNIAYDNWLLAKEAKKNSNLWAPFAGVITQSTVSAAGDRVSPADLITVVDPASMYFEAEVDEIDVAKITVGQEVELQFDSIAASTTGKISQVGFVSRTSSSGANVYPVRIQLLVSDLPKVRIGFNGDVRIIVAQAADTLLLPIEAVSDDEVVKPDGTKVKVETGLVGETEIEIKSGLQEGDVVVPNF